ncbi:MAG: argininosuccinate lyase [Firmicutes bacterium]|nr:argininosuccinate lyase [Bacillota bacterium]
MKLWGGRFSEGQSQLLEKFNNSLPFDYRLWEEDIEGSIAHGTMLSQKGILTEAEGKELVSALKEIKNEILTGKREFDFSVEDIHTQIEIWLIEKCGDLGKKLHTARSRNDQVATDLRLYTKKSLKQTIKLLLELIETLALLGKDHSNTLVPGYTHLQKAQPISYGHQLLAYAQMFLRDLDRFEEAYKRCDVLPLGSGALAGTPYKIDRELTRELLQFRAISQNSLDGVSDRDFVLDYLYACSLTMVHLSRLAEELIIYSSFEFGFVELSDSYSTGSSIMPQKKNPDVPELIRGKTGRVCGNLLGFLMTLKGLPLAYNKDMQEDKEAFFDAVDTTQICLEIITPLLKTMTVNKEKMARSAETGYLNATDLADFLVLRGVPFRSAHRIVGEVVRLGIDLSTEITDIPLGKLQEISPLIDEEILQKLDAKSCLERRNIIGGAAPNQVEDASMAILKTLEAKKTIWLDSK